MALESKEALRNAQRKWKQETVHLPDIQNDVLIREWSGGQRAEWEFYVFTHKVGDVHNHRDAVLKAVQLSLVNAAGKRLYEERELNELGDILSHRDMEVLYAAIDKLNVLSKKAEETEQKN